MTTTLHTNGFVKGLRREGRRIARRVQAFAERRKTLRELSRLDERDLNEMGLAPRDLPRLADDTVRARLRRVA